VLRVIVNIRKDGQARGHDLEVPTEVPSEQLAKMVAEALNWDIGTIKRPSRYAIRDISSGRILQPDESLADAGLWDGTYLALQQIPVLGEEKTFRSAFLESPTGKKYTLNHPHIRIGRRTPDRDIDLDLSDEPEGQTVSRAHASIVFKNGSWVLITSRGTKNPTMINGRLIEGGQSCSLTNGDLLQFGGVKLFFRLEIPDLSPDRSHKDARPITRACLIPIASNGSQGEPLPIRSRSVRLGRLSSLCEIAFSDRTVSRLHARIEEGNDGAFWIFDEHSAHGTFVNNAPIPETGYKLSSGDRIRIGDIELLFQIETSQDDPNATVALSLDLDQADSDSLLTQTEKEDITRLF